MSNAARAPHTQRFTIRVRGIIGTALAVSLTVALMAASLAQASQSHELTLSQIKAAIDHYAGKVGMEVERTHNKRAAEGELDGRRLVFDGAWLSKCETHNTGGRCYVQYRFSDEKCFQWLGALPTRPITVTGLTEPRCTESNNSELDISPR